MLICSVCSCGAVMCSVVITCARVQQSFFGTKGELVTLKGTGLILFLFLY